MEQGAEPLAERSASWPTWRKAADVVPPLVVRAWELWCMGEHNYSAIARALGFEGYEDSVRKQVKRDIARYSNILAERENSGDVDARSEIMQMLFFQQRELLRIYGNADKPLPMQKIVTADGTIKEREPQAKRDPERLKLWALRQLAEVTDRIAALKGVATRREVHENEGDVSLPPVFNIGIAVREAEDAQVVGARPHVAALEAGGVDLGDESGGNGHDEP